MVIAISRDISERKETERALRESEARLQMIAANVSECFCIGAPDFSKVYYVNEACENIYGLRREEILRQPMALLRVVHADDVSRLQDGIATLARGEAIELEYRVRPDGSPERWLHVRARPVEGYDGTSLVVSVAADITRRKQLEVERHQDELRQRDALVREVHHRVKNHLQGVIGLLWQRGSEYPELATVFKESVGLMQTVATIYGLQGIKADTQVVLDEMLAAIVQSQSQLTGAAIDMQNSSGNTKPLIVAKDEAVPLALAINELITNAIKHSTDRRAMIRIVNIDGDETRARISISNTGTLPPDYNAGSTRRSGMGMRLIRTLLPARSGITVSHSSTPEGVVTATLLIGPPAVFRRKW
jgi:PAS domain S-box-containing protein